MSILEDEGPEKFLSFEERTQLRRYLKDPSEFPTEFGSWVEEYVGTHANLQKSQVQGLPLLNTQVQDALADIEEAQAAIVANQVTADSDSTTTEVSTAGGFWQAPGGGVISGLAAGTYLILYGAELRASGGVAYLTVAHTLGVGPVVRTISSEYTFFTAFTTVTLPASAQTYIVYAATDGGTAFMRNRNIAAIRIGA